MCREAGEQEIRMKGSRQLERWKNRKRKVIADYAELKKYMSENDQCEQGIKRWKKYGGGRGSRGV